MNGDSMEGFVINYLDNWVAKKNWNKCKWNSLLKRMIWNNWESKGCEGNRRLENAKRVKKAKDIDRLEWETYCTKSSSKRTTKMKNLRKKIVERVKEKESKS